jgi:hypothetical protein
VVSRGGRAAYHCVPSRFAQLMQERTQEHFREEWEEVPEHLNWWSADLWPPPQMLQTTTCYIFLTHISCSSVIALHITTRRFRDNLTAVHHTFSLKCLERLLLAKSTQRGDNSDAPIACIFSFKMSWVEVEGGSKRYPNQSQRIVQNIVVVMLHCSASD